MTSCSLLNVYAFENGIVQKTHFKIVQSSVFTCDFNQYIFTFAEMFIFKPLENQYETFSASTACEFFARTAWPFYMY